MEEKDCQAALPDEERVFLACVEDILQETPGLHYALEVEPSAARGGERAYATLTIETNPLCELALAIELWPRAFVVVVNGQRYLQKRGRASRFEWWVERRCRDLTAMISGDLRVERHLFISLTVTGTIAAGAGKKWRILGTYENGWAGVLPFFLPFGLFVTREKTVLYSDWFRVGAGG